jgi:2-polyprenyl-3-methyl-5-hydroxy-6-metoxy-1,4-benzoquinol methylase
VEYPHAATIFIVKITIEPVHFSRWQTSETPMSETAIQNFLATSFDHEGKSVQVEMTAEEHRALFERIQAQWTGYGESEPFASVLSDAQFKKENIDANMHLLEASGNEVVRRLQVLAQRNQIALPTGTCFELGCGVGRITKPLSRVFERVIAADISPGNLAECRKHLDDTGLLRVDTLLLQSPRQIESVEGIDAFVSIIVLQHNPPPIQYYLLDRILGEINTGGVAFFQTATFNPGYGYQVPYHLGLNKTDFESWSLHCLPMKHVLKLLQKHGLDVLEIVEDGQTGGLHNRFHSHTFFAAKR